MKIKGKTFIVTGGASGLGEATVRLLVKKGANLSIFDLNEELGAKLLEEKELSKVCIFSKVDVASEESVKKALEATLTKFGALHGVVQCAGVSTPTRVISSRGTVHPLQTFKTILDINLVGTFNVLRLAAAVIAKQQPVEGGERGIFIHTASVAAYEGQIGQAAYSASKSGVVGMTLPIAREFAAIGIRVNTIAPGMFKTPLFAKLPQKAYDSLIEQIPFPHRLGEPAEFADLCAFLIENQYMNGETIRLDASIRMSAL